MLNVLEAGRIIILKKYLISLAQRVHFLQDVLQMATIALVSVITHFHINGLHLFWDTLFVYIYIYIYIYREREREWKGERDK